MSSTKGQASIVMVLLLGLVAVGSALASSSISVNNVQIENTILMTNKAWYAAWAGVDELMIRLRSRQNFGALYSVSLTLPGGATVSASISGDNTQKTIEASGYSGEVIKRLEVKVASSSSKASFVFAAQSGEGGFELEGNTSVTGADGSDGNVYSNGAVLGIKANSGVSGSKILGSVWAVSSIGGLNELDDGGVYIKRNAYANALRACLIGGNVKAPMPPSDCPYSGIYTIASAPAAVPLASVDSNYWKDKALAGGTWSGNCDVGGGGGTDCTSGTLKLGDRQILGDLNVPSGTNLTLTGPVWVKGDINISQNNTLFTDESVGKNSVVVVASEPGNPNVKGRIITSSNVQFNRNTQGAGLIFISENLGDNCSSSPAVDITSNTATVVFVATSGCINIGSNSVISGVLGKKVHLKNNSSVVYDPSLAQAIVAPESGGWSVISISEY